MTLDLAADLRILWWLLAGLLILIGARAIGGATLGTLAGIFFGIPGLIVGPFAGTVIGEYSAP